MALSFAKKKAAPAATNEEADAAPPKTSTPKSTHASDSSGASFLKKGKAAAEAVAAEEAKAELAKQQSGKMFRFWMEDGGERKISFLDGDLNEDGMLDIYMFYEHSIKVNGNWTQFVCTSESEGSCPICDKGDSRPYLAGVMTVVDHTSYKVKEGKNAGKIYVNQRKIFAAKKETMKKLTKIAIKRGGLTGCTFEVSRSGDKSASVGDTFEFVSKQTLAKIKAEHGIEDENFGPADYGEEIKYVSAADLIELGVGKAANGPGYEKAGKSLKDQL